MNNPISNNVFDTRDLIEYKEFIESEIVDGYKQYLANKLSEESEEDIDFEKYIEDTYHWVEFYDIENNEDFDDYIESEYFQPDNFYNWSEYVSFIEFYNDLSDSPDFEYGECVIHESYFEEYCEDYVKDCGYLPNDLPSFIYNNIDWSGIADDLKSDYIEVSYNNESYFIRA